MVDDWSRIRDLVEQLRLNAEGTVEEQILADPGLGSEIWSRIGHIAANPAMIAITRIEGSDLFDAFMDIYEPSIAPSIAHVLQRFSEGVFEVAWPEMTVAAADGRPLTVRGRILVPPAYRDTWRIVLSTFEDMTEVRARERELLEAKWHAEQAANAKSEFLATMSHEFRTPLNAIMGFAQVMQAETFGPVGDPRYVRYAEDIIASGEHLLGLVEDILDLAQADAGKMVLNETTFAFPDLAQQVLRLIHDRAARSGIAIELDLPSGLAFLRADARRLRQLLLNLLTNAMKFTPARGTIAVSATCDPDRGFSFCVSDTGPGMTQEERIVAMEPFGQVLRINRSKPEGWGLGLPIARHLAELHGGSLELESTPGQGTRVHVHLPAHRIVPR
jgi:signal transduction histidine kinase